MKPYLLMAFFGAFLVMACHKSETPLIDVGWHPIAPPGSWQWVEEDWILFQGAGVIKPSPDSLIVLYLNPDKSFTVYRSAPAQPTGTWRIDTTQTQGTNGVYVDSFLVFSTAPQLAAGVTIPTRVSYRVRKDSLYLTTLVTPAGLSTFVFAAAK